MPNLVPDYQYEFRVTIRDSWDQSWMNQHEGTGDVPLGVQMLMLRRSYEAYARDRAEHDRLARREQVQTGLSVAQVMDDSIWGDRNNPIFNYGVQAQNAASPVFAPLVLEATDPAYIPRMLERWREIYASPKPTNKHRATVTPLPLP